MPISGQILRSVPIFHLLDDSELAELASHIDEMSYHENQLIFKAGDPGVNMQIVLEGRVQTYLTDDDGKKIVVAEFDKGEMFGELSLLDSEPRSASAIALAPTLTFIIDRDDLIRLFSRKPEAALDIMATLGNRIRKTDALLRTRVARNVNELADEELTFGQRIADGVAQFGGSWNFITLFAVVLFGWIILNTWVLFKPFDPQPYILLNLILSMLAALQAPVIMMSQNRQAAKDRLQADLDYHVNLKAELEITELQLKLDALTEKIDQIAGQTLPQNGRPV